MSRFDNLLVCTECWTPFYDLDQTEPACPNCEGLISKAILWSEFLSFAPEVADFVKDEYMVIGLNFKVPVELQEKIKKQAQTTPWRQR